MALIDSNVLIDIASEDPQWSEWSLSRLELAARNGRLLINAVVYAEVSVRFDRLEDIDIFLGKLGVVVEAISPAALFLAGRAFTQYRRAGGTRTGVLPDFFIGAHAAVAGLPLLTRDANRYRKYFPTIELIAPNAA